jgi:Fe(3+) dicitrate transport protein
MKIILTSCLVLAFRHLSLAQEVTDSLRTVELKEVIITGYRTMNGIGHLENVNGASIFAGKKTEVLLIDSIDANRAINNTRQILGRIPGLNIVESETGGFVANGIGIRGLNPIQSTEMNVRQNGYTVTADVFGYNEAYYLPPMEAVQRVEMLKGSAGLQFGPQFGGMINYVLKDGSMQKKPIELNASQTIGSFGLSNSFLSAGGKSKKWNYFSYLQYRTLNGWRQNSGQNQFSGFGRLQYQPNNRLTVGLEYTVLRNKIKMPGGLTDVQYINDSRSSNRNRNWVNSPWNIWTLSSTYKVSNTTNLHFTSSYLQSQRNLVWFEEGANEMDLPDPTTSLYQNRDVEKKYMKGSSSELRLLSNYNMGKTSNILGAGIRFSYSKFRQQEDGIGTSGSDYNFSVINNDFEEDFKFSTLNFAPFVENVFQFSDRFSVTPGIRIETLTSSIEGKKEDASTSTEFAYEQKRTRHFTLFGIGVEYQLNSQSQIFGNLSPLGVISRVDPNMRDSKGYTADLGVRGTWKDILNYDLSAFYLAYNNRIGLETRDDGSGNLYTYRTNVADSEHKGLESYLEINVLKLAGLKRGCQVSLFNSFTYVNAIYKNGEFEGKKVEYAPNIITRSGVTLWWRKLSGTFQTSYQANAFGDAGNTVTSIDGITGLVPSYMVMDLSASYAFTAISLKAGVNNLADTKYFTYRTDEYPGPGIIPAIGRSFYAGATVKF